ncbi:hypothetical protein GJAV_G00219640 [Gymnothorax javanicus]|nr:hypothetical protein GJAV_G00219640 [Gymnothorax javanicus]
MRDYCLIRDNVHTSRTLIAVLPIQLFDVNRRTLLQWHNERGKAIMAETVTVAVPGPSAEQMAAEPLPPAQALLKEPLRPDRPMEFPQPEDASGQAVTFHGPLAPELCGLMSATAGATAASSFDTAGTPATCSTPAAPFAPAAPRAPRKTFTHFLCKCCGQPKTKEYNHSRYRGEHFCSQAEGRSVEDWLAEKRRMEAGQPPSPLRRLKSSMPPFTRYSLCHHLPSSLCHGLPGRHLRGRLPGRRRACK